MKWVKGERLFAKRSQLGGVLALTVFAMVAAFDAGFRTEVEASGNRGSEFCEIEDANELAVRAGLADDLRNGVRLLTNHQEVESGEVVIARLANLSDRYLMVGAEFHIQRYDGTGWHTDPSSPDGPWPRSAQKLKPDRAARCYRYVVPEGQPAGRYRFLTSISTRTELYSRNYRKVAEFLIRNHGSGARAAIRAQAPELGTELSGWVNRPRPMSCPQATEVDYGAPLADLPPLPPNTLDRLGIGPPRLRLNGVGDTLNIGEGEVGYRLAVDRRTIRRPVALDGYTELELDRVRRGGRVIQTVAARRQALGVVASPAFNGKFFLVDVPSKPGLYRFQARLRDAKGKMVGRFADYLRVVRPVIDVRLVFSRGPVEPGSRVDFWIENRGAQKVYPLGLAFAFEVFEGGSWSKAPGNPEYFPKVGVPPLSSGEAGACNSFQIPADAKPGLYRLSKNVVLESGARRQLTAEFEVSSG